jgi:3-keto-disaccharide hydrolase
MSLSARDAMTVQPLISARILRFFLSVVTAIALSGTVAIEPAAAAEPEQWHELFNGRDLSGWTIKIAKQPLNDNYADTFRVDDGVLKVSYDGYDKFQNRFGHLYTNQPYSNYLLRLEYRITGQGLADALIGRS